MARLEVRGFPSARDAVLAPGNVCALVGGASAGKSNLLAALHAVVDPERPAPRPEDLAGDGELSNRAELVGGGVPAVEGVPPDRLRVSGGERPPC